MIRGRVFPGALLMSIRARGLKPNYSCIYIYICLGKMAEILRDTIIIIMGGVFFISLYIFSPPNLSRAFHATVTISHRIRHLKMTLLFSLLRLLYWQYLTGIRRLFFCCENWICIISYLERVVDTRLMTIHPIIPLIL